MVKPIASSFALRGYGGHVAKNISESEGESHQAGRGVIRLIYR